MPEKLKLYITADVILLKAARNFQVNLISAKFVLLEIKYGTISDIRIFWSEKLLGKSKGIMKTYVCGNHDQFLVIKAWKMTWFGISRLV